MTPEELLAMAEKATPGPYRIEVCDDMEGRKRYVLLAAKKPNGTSTVMADLVPGKANRAYLAAAANHAPAMARRLVDIGAIVANAFEWDGNGYHIDADAAKQLYDLLLDKKAEPSE